MNDDISTEDIIIDPELEARTREEEVEETQPRLAVKLRPPRKKQRGLTLIEILVVVTILGIIAGIVGVAVMGALEDSRIDTAKIQMSEIAKALEVYKVKLHRYPSTQEGLNALSSPPKGKKPFMEKIPKDQWDNDFIYVSPGQHNKSKFDLQSKGPDGIADNEDDITNW